MLTTDFVNPTLARGTVKSRSHSPHTDRPRAGSYDDELVVVTLGAGELLPDTTYGQYALAAIAAN